MTYYQPISSRHGSMTMPNSIRSIVTKYGAPPMTPSRDPGRPSPGGMLRLSSGTCTCTCRENRICCLTLQQSTLVAGFIAVIFSLLIFAHEIALEGGFSLRNYVVLAFCVIWLIVTALLSLGTYKRAPFMLLPWMILTSVLMPLFLVAIIAGCKVIAECMQEESRVACLHEFHLFGTNDHVCASLKLTFLCAMFVINCLSFLVVYKYFTVLTNSENRKREHESGLLCGDDTATLHYERFQDGADELMDDSETNLPLCQHEDDDSRETVT